MFQSQILGALNPAGSQVLVALSCGLASWGPPGSHRDTPGSCDAPECEFGACLVLVPGACGSTQGYCEVQEASGRVCATRTVMGKKMISRKKMRKVQPQCV